MLWNLRDGVQRSHSPHSFFFEGVGGGTYSVRDPLEPKPLETWKPEIYPEFPALAQILYRDFVGGFSANKILYYTPL